MKRTLLPIAAVTVVAALAGCSSVTPEAAGLESKAPKDVREVTIGFAQRQVDAPYFAAMVDLAEKKSAKDGFSLRVQNASGDAVTQLNQAQTLVAQGVDVLVVDAMSPKSQRVQFEQLAGEIPLVFVDTGISGVGITSISSDNYAIGKLSGGLAAKRFAPGVPVTLAILNGGPDDEIVGPNRQKGFLDGLKEAGVEYTIAAEASAVYSQDRAVPATESILAANPNVDLIVGLNDSMTLGALTVLRDQGNTRTLVAAAADGQKEALKEIIDGGCSGQYVSTGLNSPSIAADRAFDVAIEVATGTSDPASYADQEYTKAAGINCENARDYYDPNAVF